jgi:F-type H+-transporting ATPase subunit b
MQIDWLTVAAQIVNFLVLVWLLKHFLYGPVTRAMARREERIAERVQSAREREDAAERERERLHERMDRLEDRRDAVLEQAREEADGEKQRLLEEARADVDDKREQWRQQLRDEQDAFLKQLRRQTAEGFAALARKALSDLADVRLEDRMFDTLDKQLAGLDDDERQQFRNARELVVSTSFALEDDRRGRLRDLIQQHLGDGTKPDFEQDKALVCGIALTADGRRLAWSLADYLDGFERKLTAHLDQRQRESADTESETDTDTERGKEAATS